MAYKPSKHASATVASFTSTLDACIDAATAASEKEGDSIPDFEKYSITPRHAVARALRQPLLHAQAILFIAHGMDLDWVQGISEVIRYANLLESVRWAGILVHGADTYEETAYAALTPLNRGGVALLPRAVACLPKENSRKHLKLGAELAHALYSIPEWEGREQSQAA